MSRSKILDINAGSLAVEEIYGPNKFLAATGTSPVLNVADTMSTVGPNTIIKYVNVMFETGLRDTAPAAPGFIEYAVIHIDRETGPYVIPASITGGFGTQTLGDLCRNIYRGDCIWYGSFPVSREIPQTVPLSIKLPDKACRCKSGAQLLLLVGHHGLNVADTTSDARTFLTIGFKAYL